MRAPELEEFCRDSRPRLVGAVGAYCGDLDVAEDVAQEALARACDRWDEVREMDAPDGWVYRVAINLVNARYRRKRVERRVLDQLASPDRWHQDRDAATVVAVREAVAMLPARQRAAVTLRYLLDWPVADVADALGVSKGAVRSLTHRGVTRLREHFDQEQRRRLAQLAVTLTVVIAVLGVSVAALAFASDLSEPADVFIDDVPSSDTDDSSPGMELEVSGDLEGSYVLRGPAAVTEDGETPKVLRFGTRDRALIVVDTSDDMIDSAGDPYVMLVLDGHNFHASQGECEVSVDRVRRQTTPDGDVQVVALEGALTCRRLVGGPAGEEVTVDLEGVLTP